MVLGVWKWYINLSGNPMVTDFGCLVFRSPLYSDHLITRYSKARYIWDPETFEILKTFENQIHSKFWYIQNSDKIDSGIQVVGHLFYHLKYRPDHFFCLAGLFFCNDKTVSFSRKFLTIWKPNKLSGFWIVIAIQIPDRFSNGCSVKKYH
jgi:hypothetical protein